MPSPEEAFTSALLTRVLEATHRNQPGVEGTWGFELPLSRRRKVLDATERVAERLGFASPHYDPATAGKALAEILALAAGLARTTVLLADDESRELLLDVLCARVLGEHHASLPVSQAAVRAATAEIDASAREEEAAERARDFDVPLHLYRVEAAGGSVQLIGRAFMVHEFFGDEQYVFARGTTRVAAQAGDTVIDGGGGWGETALFFADAVGEAGHVLAFEFVPDNLRLLDKSLSLNPRLADRIEIVRHPVWDSTGDVVHFDDAGGQTVLADEGRSHTRTETIDNVCGGRRVDFIKLDVEGAETRALRGAEQTIREHRPKLAISVYHSVVDMVEIPAWLDSLELGYRLHLQHKWPGAAETMLFAHAG